jgi:hypothetical protein
MTRLRPFLIHLNLNVNKASLARSNHLYPLSYVGACFVEHPELCCGALGTDARLLGRTFASDFCGQHLLLHRRQRCHPSPAAARYTRARPEPRPGQLCPLLKRAQLEFLPARVSVAAAAYEAAASARYRSFGSTGSGMAAACRHRWVAFGFLSCQAQGSHACLVLVFSDRRTDCGKRKEALVRAGPTSAAPARVTRAAPMLQNRFRQQQRGARQHRPLFQRLAECANIKNGPERQCRPISSIQATRQRSIPKGVPERPIALRQRLARLGCSFALAQRKRKLSPAAVSRYPRRQSVGPGDHGRDGDQGHLLQKVTEDTAEGGREASGAPASDGRCTERTIVRLSSCGCCRLASTADGSLSGASIPTTAATDQEDPSDDARDAGRTPQASDCAAEGPRRNKEDVPGRGASVQRA